MITEKELELQEILDYTNVTKLPKAYDEAKSKKIWVDAIIEIRKKNGTTSYAYAYNDYGHAPIYKKMVGGMSVITGIANIYPLNYLSKDFLPHFENRDDIVKYVSEAYKTDMEKINALEDDGLKTLAYSYAIKRQIMYMEENKLK